jgi:hypothetical protein
MTAVEWFAEELYQKVEMKGDGKVFDELLDQAKEMEEEQKIELLKSLVYSVCIGDDVEDVEEWLKEHELNKSE